jgi:hypothetical protein
MSEVKVNKECAVKLYQALKLAYHEIQMVANYCEENGMNDDAASYNNLAFYLCSVLQEAKLENDSKPIIKVVQFNKKESEK